MKQSAWIVLGLVILGLVGVSYLIYQQENPNRTSLKVATENIINQPSQPPAADQPSSGTKTAAAPKPMKLQKPTLTIDQNKIYIATLETSKGTIDVQLDAKNTPITTNNFVYLANQGFYNNTIFHRVIKGFMIQGGDPNGNGTGGPGYSFADEPVVAKYTRGTIAMANSGPNTNGSQFFIMHQDYDLPPNYVIFGSVIKGIETVDAIAESAVKSNGMGETSQPIEPISVVKVTISQQ